MFSVDEATAQGRFKAFNEELNHEQCLEDRFYTIRKADDEARVEIKQLLGELEIAHVKSLPRSQRNAILRRVKHIKGLSQRQAARISGVSANLIFKA
ncbi:hypothetical protein GCM10008983_19000 [Lentibacillus halophilus]|uniref:Transcriptional regulator n=1 Tax=Lentibacillus halophilus TaxID=295065 RepID=A0ABP3J7K9_9BACI